MRKLCLCLLVGLVAGCQSKTPMKVMPLGKRPPEGSARKVVPLDPSLAAKATQIILADASSGDAVTRAHAIEAIQKTMPDRTDIVITAMNDSEPVVRFAAAMAAGQMRIAAAHDPLSKLAEDANSTVRIGAAFALHRLGDYTHSAELAKATAANDPQVRSNAALALGLIGDKTALSVLKPMERDPDPAVRLQVAEAQWRLGDSDGLNSLAGDMVSRFPDLQMFATVAIAEPHDQRARSQVRPNLTTDFLEVNLCAARAMGMLDSDEGYGVAEQGAKSNDPMIKSLAAFAFGAIGRADAQPILEKMLTDGDGNVRIAAATAVLQVHN